MLKQLIAITSLLLLACIQDAEPRSGAESHFLQICNDSAGCREPLQCICVGLEGKRRELVTIEVTRAGLENLRKDERKISQVSQQLESLLRDLSSRGDRMQASSQKI